jgi:hypothetical protein
MIKFWIYVVYSSMLWPNIILLSSKKSFFEKKEEETEQRLVSCDPESCLAWWQRNWRGISVQVGARFPQSFLPTFRFRGEWLILAMKRDRKIFVHFSTCICLISVFVFAEFGREDFTTVFVRSIFIRYEFIPLQSYIWNIYLTIARPSPCSLKFFYSQLLLLAQ